MSTFPSKLFLAVYIIELLCPAIVCNYKNVRGTEIAVHENEATIVMTCQLEKCKYALCGSIFFGKYAFSGNYLFILDRNSGYSCFYVVDYYYTMCSMFCFSNQIEFTPKTGNPIAGLSLVPLRSL